MTTPYATIELSQGRLACVDAEDYQWLSQWKWCYYCGKKNNTGYAMRVDCSNQKRRQIQMHIAIMRQHQRWGHKRQVDHINTCGCDNRKVNLRLVTRSKQNAHKGPRSDNTSGIIGVRWHKRDCRWYAQIMVNKKQKHLGYFINKKDAVTKRRKAEIKHFGEYRYDKTKLCPLWKTGQCPDCAKRAQELGLKP